MVFFVFTLESEAVSEVNLGSWLIVVGCWGGVVALVVCGHVGEYVAERVGCFQLCVAGGVVRFVG